MDGSLCIPFCIPLGYDVGMRQYACCVDGDGYRATYELSPDPATGKRRVLKRRGKTKAIARQRLDQAVRDGRIRRGQKICVVGFGAGLVYGSAIFEY